MEDLCCRPRSRSGYLPSLNHGVCYEDKESEFSMHGFGPTTNIEESPLKRPSQVDSRQNRGHDLLQFRSSSMRAPGPNLFFREQRRLIPCRHPDSESLSAKLPEEGALLKYLMSTVGCQPGS